MDTAITPTVGRIMWFWPDGEPPYAGTDQPQAAIVTYVWEPRLVNLTVFDREGNTRAVTSVRVRQEGDDRPYAGYATWMPYQIGQAKKAEAARASSTAL